jgi:hypothetical protein
MTTTVLRPPVAPRLPSSPEEPDQLYLQQFNNVLRLYFNQVDNTLGALIPASGAFSSYVSQTASSTTVQNKLLFEVTDFSYGVTAPSSQIKVGKPGIYNLQFSVQVQNLQNASTDMSIWLSKTTNGVPTAIAGSTGLIGLPSRKSVSDPSHDIKGWNYFVSMGPSDLLEIYWSVSDVLMTIPTYAAGTSPVKPSTASVVVTMTFVSVPPA